MDHWFSTVCLGHSMGKEYFFNKWCQDNWILTYKIMRFDTYNIPHTTINSKLTDKKFSHIELYTVAILI